MPNDPIIQVYRIWSQQHTYYLKLRIDQEEKIIIEYRTQDQLLKCLNTYDMENIERIKHYKYIKENDYCNIQTDNSFQFMNDQKLLIIEEKHGLRKIQILYYLIIGMLFFKKGQEMKVEEIKIIEILLDVEQKDDENHSMVNELIVNICKDIKLNVFQNDEKIQSDPYKFDWERLIIQLDPPKLYKLPIQSDPFDFDWEKFKQLNEIEYPPLKQYQKIKQEKNKDRYELVQCDEQKLMKDATYGFQLQDSENICILKKGLFQNEHFQGEIIEYDKQKNEIIHYINITIDKTEEKFGQNVRICYLSPQVQVNPIKFIKKRSYRGGFSKGKYNGKGIMIKYDKEGKVGEFYYSGKWENGFLNGFGIFQYLKKELNEEQLQYRKYIGEFQNSQFHGQGIACLNRKNYAYTQGKFKNNRMVGKHQIITANQIISKYYCC